MTRLGGPVYDTNGRLFLEAVRSPVTTTPRGALLMPHQRHLFLSPVSEPTPSAWSDSKFTVLAIIHTVSH